MRDCEVGIVGAGAAGLATAIFAKQADPSASVVLLEGARRPGAKILVSGGGRCNVTNTEVSEADFWGGRSTIVRRVLRTFPVAETVAFFRNIGVPLHVEPDGKLFPDSNRARDVLDALLRTASAAGVVLLPDHRVLDVSPGPDGFRIETTGGVIRAKSAVLASGGRSLPKSGSDGAGYAIAERLGHSIVPVTPALAPLLLGEPSFHRTLQGVSQQAELTIWVNGAAGRRLRGSLLWTHFGISGPVAMNASRHWARARLERKTVAITANFCDEPFERVEARLVALFRNRPKTSIQSALSERLPSAMARALLADVAVDPDLSLGRLTRQNRRRVAHALTEWAVPVLDTRGYTYAEATAGGVQLSEIDPGTMESRTCPGLYLVGEILDVDGRIGGFNFQWAWSSAWVASRGLAGGRGR